MPKIAFKKIMSLNIFCSNPIIFETKLILQLILKTKMKDNRHYSLTDKNPGFVTRLKAKDRNCPGTVAKL